MAADRYPVFTAWMKTKGFVPEHKFHKTRKWLFDYANTSLLIAVEIQGGIWMAKGAHNTGTAIMRDIEKHNEAILGGWALLLVHPGMIKNGEAYNIVDRAMVDLDLLHEAAEEIELLSAAIIAMAEDGWLHFGPEGMSEAQQKCYAVYLAIKTPNAKVSRDEH